MAVESGTVAGVVAGRYSIDAELASGGMGVVYRVVDRPTGKVLALKRSLADGSGSGPRNAALLEREYRTLVTLRHPCIIRVYDYGVDEVSSFYTMELLDGADLRANSPVEWRVLCRNLRDVALSLALLHSRRLLHRDVSAGNIRLTGEGRAKLIDFGTLMSFGKTDIVAGTPAGVAPEALEGLDLDHRVDLYALGATAYYALTKRHAYSARALSDLTSVWSRGPPPAPSSLVPGIPAELDELVLSLLRLDRSLRPASAAEVIDRLGAIAGLAPERDDRIAASYLVSLDPIGREREIARFGSRLERLIAGRGSSLLVSGAAGHGRSTLLTRFEKDARVAGATVLGVNARAYQYPYGIWQALMHRALTEAPDEAARSGAELGRPVSLTRGIGAEEAFERFFLALATAVPVVLLIDDIHTADNDSLPLFARLAKAAAKHRLLVVASFDTGDPAANRPALKLLRRGSSRLGLQPFDPDQTERFVRSIFGDVASAKRLAVWLQRQTGGNPSLCSGLVSHLVKEGRIHYAEGTWVLPHDFPDQDVRAVMTATVTGHLARLRPAQRRFAECLSPHRRSLDGKLCLALMAGDPELSHADGERLLEELVREGLLVGDASGFAFARPQVRELLYAGLGESRRRALHRHAALELAARAGGNPEREFEVGRHLLLAGDRSGAYDRISNSMVEVVSRPDALVRSVPELWDLYEEYQRIGGTADELLLVTASLVVSGYYVDPAVHDAFGESTAEQLQRRTGFALAARLAPWLGSYPALFLGMGWGLLQYVWFLRTGRIDRFGTMFLSFVGVCASRSAVGYLRIEPHTHDQLFRLLAPAKGLHRHNALRLVHDLLAIAVAEKTGAFGAAYDGYLDQLSRLPHVRLFEEESRHHYEAGLLCSLGRCDLLRTGAEALRCADRVDAMGGEHDRILAQYLRCSYHLYRGETAKAEAAHDVLDTMAARYGHRWIPDILAVLDFVPYHLSGDVVGLKRVLHWSERLIGVAPAYATYRDVIRAMYEGHRGRPEVALELYEPLGTLTPFSHPAWSFALAHRAECLNALGRHEQALALCQDALKHVGDLSRVFVVAYQQLERESAMALAGLGRTEEAARWLDELLTRHERDSQPLLLGLLHRDRARVARIARDPAAFERHSKAACDQFSLTENPTLLGQARRLAELMPALEGAPLRATAAGAAESFGLLHSVVGEPLDAVAQRALELIVQFAGASGGYLYLLRDGKPILLAGHGAISEPPRLEHQVEQMLATFTDDADFSCTSVMQTPDEESAPTLLPLVFEEDTSRPMGVAAVFGCRSPKRRTEQLLREVAQALRAGAVTVMDRPQSR